MLLTYLWCRKGLVGMTCLCPVQHQLKELSWSRHSLGGLTSWYWLLVGRQGPQLLSTGASPQAAGLPHSWWLVSRAKDLIEEGRSTRHCYDIVTWYQICCTLLVEANKDLPRFRGRWQRLCFLMGRHKVQRVQRTEGNMVAATCRKREAATS